MDFLEQFSVPLTVQSTRWSESKSFLGKKWQKFRTFLANVADRRSRLCLQFCLFIIFMNLMSLEISLALEPKFDTMVSHTSDRIEFHFDLTSFQQSQYRKFEYAFSIVPFFSTIYFSVTFGFSTSLSNMEMMSFPVELRNCTNLTVKFNGFLSWKRPIEKINDSTWVFNRAELIPELFRQFGPSIVEVSVRFDGFFVPSSKWMQDIVNNAATFCTESMKSFVLMSWWPCHEQPKSLFDIENLHQLHIVDQLSIYDSEWSSLLMDQINRIFPKLSKLNFLRIDFKESDRHHVDGLENLKHLKIQCQLQTKYLQRNIFDILDAHRGLEHVTLELDGKPHFWKIISEKLKSLPSLKFDYLPKHIADCNGSITFHVQKVHLVVSPNIQRCSLIFDKLKVLTLSAIVAHYNRELINMWVDFIIGNQRIEKLNVFAWLACNNQEHLAKILKNLKELRQLAIVDCHIKMSDIMKTLVISRSIEKVHLINYGQSIQKLDGAGWAITRNRKNDVLLQKI